jgi:hypothetical protein
MRREAMQRNPLATRVFATLVREPASVIRQVLRVERERLSALRRAVALRELGDALCIARPPFWSARSRRAYLRVVRILSRTPFNLAVREGDPGSAATLMVREARRPFRRAAFAGAKLSAVVVIPALAILLVLDRSLPVAHAWLFPPNVAARATWRASSAIRGYRRSGKSPSTTKDLFFHTEKEDHPWIQIDLPEEARLRTVRIENRSDCCAERALPLDVQVPDGGGWRRVCQRRAPFSTWTCHFPPTRTKTLRVVLAGNDFLHLRSVSAFE